MFDRHAAFARVLAIALAGVLLALGLAMPALAQAQAKLELGDLTLLPGSGGVMEARLSCSPACGSAAITLTFDPALLRVDGVRLGGALGDPEAGQVAAVENSIDNVSGRVDLALLAAAPVPQPTDSLLFSLEVTPLTLGQTALTATRAEFSDLRGAPLSGEVTGGAISATEQGAVEATPTPAAQLEATPIAAETPTPAPISSGEACIISTVTEGVPIHVGPDRNRAIRSSLPVQQDVAVTGQFTDAAGQLWWRVQPAGVTTELDRYWVLESAVDERGDCANVPQTEGSAVISTGAGFSHRFAAGERSFSHPITLSGDNFTLTCSGTPVYPEFQVGQQRSNGQTAINLSGSGTQTLTVFSTVVNQQGQVTPIVDYSCSLAPR